MSSVKPIRPGADREPCKLRELAAAHKAAIEEQQQRAWELRNLIQCVALAERLGELEDLEAAFEGVLGLADTLHLALDAGAITERAQAICDEEVREAGRRVHAQAALEDFEATPTEQ